MMPLWNAKARIYGWRERLPVCHQIYLRELAQLQALSKALPQIQRHLDLGTGTGASLAAFPIAHMCVISDFSPPMLQRARRRKNLPPVCFDARAVWPFQDRTFDFVSAVGVLEYLPDLDHFFSELTRVTTPFAQAILTTTPPGFLALLRTLTGARPRTTPGPLLLAQSQRAGWRVCCHARTLLQEQWLCAKASA